MKKIGKIFIVFLSIFLVVVSSFGDTINVFAETTELSQNDETIIEESNEVIENSSIQAASGISPFAVDIANLVGTVSVSTTNPYSGQNFDMDIQINSVSNGAETDDGIQGYTISFQIPTSVEIVSYPTGGNYTITPAAPKSGDTVTIKFIDELQMAKLQKVKFVFKFKEGVSIPTNTFKPTITLSADNATGATIESPLVTPQNKTLPTIMTVTPDGENPTFVHSAVIKLKAEDTIGGLNHQNSTLKITFPSEADIFAVNYKGTNYPVTTDGAGNQVVNIPIGTLAVGTEDEIQLIYSYPSLVGAGAEYYQIKVEYDATRYGINEPVHEEYAINEEVIFYDGDVPSSNFFSKDATNLVFRKAGEAVSFEINFTPVGDTKDIAIIDDPVRGNETDYFSALVYDTIMWQAIPGNDPTYANGIATKVYYQTTTTGETWHDAGNASTSGRITVADLGLASGQEITKVKYEFSYNGSSEVPAQAGKVRIKVYSTTKAGIIDNSGSLSNGITNSVYLVGQKKAVQATTYQTINDDGVENLKTSLTNYKNAAYCGFMTTNPPSTGDFTNNVFSPKTATKVGEEFTYWAGFVNLGTTLYDAKQYIVVPKTIKIKEVQFVNGQGDATYQILDTDATRQTVVINFNADMPTTNYNIGSSNKFQVRLVLEGLPGVGASENIPTYISSGNPSQVWNGGWGANVVNVGWVTLGCQTGSPTKYFDVSLDVTPLKQSSVDDAVYNLTSATTVTNPGGEPGYYSIDVENGSASEADLSEVKIIDMLPKIGDTMTISSNNKKSTFEPIINSITMMDGSALNMSNYELYYSTNATAADNKAELEDFTAAVSTTWIAWNGTTALPSNANAIKIIKKDGLAKSNTVSLKLNVTLPYGIVGNKVAWNSISVGGKYDTDSYIVPGEPNKSAIYVSDTPADKKLAGVIWEDKNGNDVRESGERLLSGMVVRLYDWDDSFIGTTTTDANGYYEFDGLLPARYRVEYDNKLGYFMSDYKVGTDKSIDSNFYDSAGDNLIGTANVNLATETNPLNIDAGLYRIANLGDFLWNDANMNGIQESSETGLDGFKIDLYRMTNGSEQFIATTTTNNGGKYLFKDLKPGSYVAKVATNSTYTVTDYLVNGSSEAKNSKLKTDWSTDEISLESNVDNLNVDFGVYVPLADLIIGSITLKKVDENNAALAGATFGIWAAGANTSIDTPITTATSDGTGVVLFSNLTEGSYIIKETTAPTGYNLNTTEYDATISDATIDIDLGNVTNTLIRGSVTLKKVDESNAALAGATFGIWANGANTSTDTPITTVTSTATGVVTFTNLLPGAYIVKETIAPLGYNLSTTEHTATVTLTDLTINLGDIENTLTRGSVTLTKVDEDSNGLSGATFGIWANGANTSTDTPITTVTSTTTGIIIFDNLLPGTYIVKETVAPTGFNLDATEHSVTITLTSLTANIGNIVNSLTRGSITLTKVDENNAALAGATFGIWADGANTSTDTPITTAVSSATGIVTFGSLLPGTYVIKETIAPLGYDLNETEYIGTVTLTNLTINLGNIGNVLTRGSITLTKVDENNAALAGATFGVWSNGANTSTDTPIATATSDATGVIEFTNLLPGTYIVKEIIAPLGYDLNTTEYTTTITLTNLIADLGNIGNVLTRGSITLTKVDENNTALAGATFGVWANGANTSTDTPITTATSDATGVIEFANLLPGTYIVKETIAPLGYDLNLTELTATITLTNLTVNLGEVLNALTTGSITLTKVDENNAALAGATFGVWEDGADVSLDSPITTTMSDATGVIEFTNLLPGTYIVKEVIAPVGYDLNTVEYMATITLSTLLVDIGEITNTLTTGSIILKKVDELGLPLAGATFGVWEDGMNPDIDTPITTAMSDGTGSIAFTNLLPGTYIVKEIIAPTGYNLDQTEHLATITLVDITINLGTITNSLTRGTIILTKVDEAGLPLMGATFGVWQQGKDTESTSPFKTATSDQNGSVEFIDLLPGTYIVKELVAPSGYELNTTEFSATITLADLIFDIGIIDNVLIRGSVNLTKVDENGTPLSGATFGIWEAESNTLVDTPFKTITSDENGVIVFEDLLPNAYIIKELSAPLGYDLILTEFSALVTLSNLNIDLGEVTNMQTRGSVLLRKTDETAIPLANATFGIWDNKSDAPLMQITSDENGQVTFSNLLPGTYTIKEIEAPSGYELNTTIYTAIITLENLTINLGDIVNIKEEKLLVQTGENDIYYTFVCGTTLFITSLFIIILRKRRVF